MASEHATATAVGSDNGRSSMLSLPPFALRHRRLVVGLLHLLLIPCGYLAALALRFDLDIPPRLWEAIGTTLPLLVMIRITTFVLYRTHDGWWRHVGMYDLIRLIKAITVGSLAFLAVLWFADDTHLLPRSVLLLEWGIAILTFGGIRFVVRWAREGAARGSVEGKRTLVVGAGDTAASLLRQIRMDPRASLQPVGLVDDDPSKRRLQIHGVSVLGTTQDMRRLVAQLGVQVVVIAIPSANRDELQQIVRRAAGLPVQIKVVPAMTELLDGTARLSQLRPVKIEELLGRDPVSLELGRVREDLQGQVVLITGGAGSIGSELARQVAGFKPRRVLLLDRAESGLYFEEIALRKAHPDLDVVPVIADVTDPARLEHVFAEFRPDYVFHAAAFKHVPLMEVHVSEAIRNNIFGTLYCARVAVQHDVKKFVLISTDKAVHPSSVMGATKRVAERIVLGLDDLRVSLTDFRAVRFGNVLGSAGSVIPLFRQQITGGGPVTVTDAEVTRFFMTIPEAVQLVLQAAALPEAASRIAMLDMGKPVRIVELAENLIRLSGLEPYTQIPIVFTGLRPGEKLHEELVGRSEWTGETSVEKIRLVNNEAEENGAVAGGLERLARSLRSSVTSEQLALLCELVPECVAPLRDRGTLPRTRVGARNGGRAVAR